MSNDDPAHWHGRLKELLARAGRMEEFEPKAPGVPAAVRQFAPRRDRMGAPTANIEIPSFLKRGPRAEEHVMPFGPKSLASRQGA